MRIRTFVVITILLLLLFAAVTLGPAIFENWEVNQFSLQVQAQSPVSTVLNSRQAPQQHLRALHWKAIAALESGDPQTSVNLLQPLIESDDIYAQQISADAYEQLGNYDQAVETWSRLQNTTALTRIAETAQAEGNLETAQNAYTAIFTISPNEGSIPLAKFLVSEMHDPIAAELVYKEALNVTGLSRHHPYILRSYATFLGNQDRWDEAIVVYKEVLSEINLFYPSERDPAKRYAELAQAQFMAGQLEEAAASIEESIRQMDAMSSKHIYIYNLAGQIYESIGEFDMAISNYRKSLAIDPDNRHALEAIDRLLGD